MESSEAGLFPEFAHLECCTEVRLFVACFICTWPANSPFLFVCLIFCTALLIKILTLFWTGGGGQICPPTVFFIQLRNR